MKAREKVNVITSLVKVWDKVLRYHEMKYSDAIRVVMGAAYSLIRYCVRMGYPGCKKNSRKADRVTIELMRKYVSPDRDEQEWTLNDDEDDDTHQTDNDQAAAAAEDALPDGASE